MAGFRHRGEALKRDAFTILDRLDQRVFDAVCGRSLVYNTCWEDPSVDRRALAIGPDDTVLAITSAGCNVLDYLLCEPRQVFAVDANPRQTALLELKLAAIRRLDFEDIFLIFGDGRHPRFREIYHDALRADLSAFARDYWAARCHWFTHRADDGSFYFHGLSGRVARIFRAYLKLRPALAEAIEAMIEARTIEAQRDIYDGRVRPQLWRGPLAWILSRQITMSMLGVPQAQRREVEAQHTDGVAGYVRGALDYVFRNFLLRDNHFWFLYLRGHYTRDTCPEYLRAGNVARLRERLIHRVMPHTCTVTEFLRRSAEPVTRFVLLDHMDWMACYHPEALAEEWGAILDRAGSGARVIFRSAHASPRYLRDVTVTWRGETRPLAGWLRLHPRLAARLSRDDRVHTYGGFHIGSLRRELRA